MAQPKSRRRTRKARGGRPSAAASSRRAERSARERQASTAHNQANRTLGTVGERPAGLFGGVPVSEFAIFAGLVALVIGTVKQGGPALEVGIIVMALGVAEVTAREHFSGFRSHTTLLAFMPAVIVGAVYVLVVGAPSQRVLLVVPAIPVFAICYWLLRRHFSVARHARVVRHD
ncbi:MAG TPA: hypothetical protein VHV75_08675 [Solirubrobacteraceae bacterium]|jgi:hypothetical protein|nr:hypothetical protein [Solirubrobacteraceae bacterium]